jgi:hypothetical protein
MKLEAMSDRVAELITLANETERRERPGGSGLRYIEPEAFGRFRVACLSLIQTLYGPEHPHFKNFELTTSQARPGGVRYGRGVLLAIQNELQGGWIHTTRGIVSAEIFSDFMEMADHLLDEHYKDAAAVMVGSVLEEHLRQLCGKFGVDVTYLNHGIQTAKKADVLNADLVKAGTYNKIDQKQVTAWLGIRNSAAHGKYAEYTEEQVKTMHAGVMNFIVRISV